MSDRRRVLGSTGVLRCLSLVNALDPLARFYRTDKAVGYHSYTSYYGRHFGSRRFNRISSSRLELGVTHPSARGVAL